MSFNRLGRGCYGSLQHLFATNRTLVHLDISNTALDGTMAEDLALALKHNHTLRGLHITGASSSCVACFAEARHSVVTSGYTCAQATVCASTHVGLCTVPTAPRSRCSRHPRSHGGDNGLVETCRVNWVE